MTLWIKHKTATELLVGPFVDAVDGHTAETALTIKKANVLLSKNGQALGASATDQGTGDAGAPHDALGYYRIALDTDDTDTLGALVVAISIAGARPVRLDCMVLASPAYGALVSGNALPVNVNQWGGAPLPPISRVSCWHKDA